MIQRVKPYLTATTLGLALVCGGAAVEAAAQPTRIIGSLDYSTVGSASENKAAMLGGLTTIRGVGWCGAAMRFEDSGIGAGAGYLVQIGVPLIPHVQARVAETRFVADAAAFRAWRFSFNPLLVLPGGQTIGLSYDDQCNETGPRLRSFGGVVTTPVLTRFTAQLGGSNTHVVDANAWQTNVGLGWRPWGRLEFLGHIGVGVVGSGQATTFSSADPGPLGRLLGREVNSTTTITRTSERAMIVHVRVALL